MLHWSSFIANFRHSREQDAALPDAKIEKSSPPCSKSMERRLQSAASELEKIVARSLRQVPVGQGPLLAWPVVCGSAVAERTHALTFMDGVLRVGVSDNGWKSELLALAPRYLASMNRYTTEPVRKIEFIVMPQDESQKGR